MKTTLLVSALMLSQLFSATSEASLRTFSSKSSFSRPSAPSRTYSASRFTPAKPAMTPPGRIIGRGSDVQRRSVLSGSGAKPSERVQTLIREKERSGPGWIGTAALVWLLSQHDLSSSDKEWVEGKINAAKAAGEKIESPPPELTAIRFTYLLPDTFTAGKAATLTVSTAGGGDKPLTCTLSGAQWQPAGQAQTTVWTPAASGSQVLQCEQANVVDERLLIIE